MSTQKDKAVSTLEDLLAKMGVSAKVAVTDEDPLTLEVKSEDAAALIGHRGEGMRALQHILRLMVRDDEEQSPVLVDIEGYRAKQQEQLQELAKRKADEVAESGRLAVLQPMSSYERRLVHVTLADREDVVTESLGEGPQRRVMIKQK